MLLQPKPSLTFDDWLANERAAIEGRSEYIDGEVFAMTGAREQHNLIVTNLIGELHPQMKGRPCRIYANDMKVRIRAANAGTYPDLVALCGEHEFLDERRDLLLNPSLIVEVLSNSTEAYDRGGKFAIYRRIPSLTEYLLVSQYRVAVELFSRGADDRWTLSEFTALDATVTLASVGCTLTLAEIYDKVDLEPV
ncbi:Uma2 family endonuclease [uncultured Thiodictyon sp.]|jgi:Uma2 family endonuclease|uniref:Uma2 family endonuclease n=1 Tax=uncultured Thiodictyon sp. TaxID=1846217 RepID=UPI0025E57CC8|nr:Uma2 family endonuclease [uncultured Thiodictyon sp.]